MNLEISSNNPTPLITKNPISLTTKRHEKVNPQDLQSDGLLFSQPVINALQEYCHRLDSSKLDAME